MAPLVPPGTPPELTDSPKQLPRASPENVAHPPGGPRPPPGLLNFAKNAPRTPPGSDFVIFEKLCISNIKQHILRPKSQCPSPILGAPRGAWGGPGPPHAPLPFPLGPLWPSEYILLFLGPFNGPSRNSPMAEIHINHFLFYGFAFAQGPKSPSPAPPQFAVAPPRAPSSPP